MMLSYLRGSLVFYRVHSYISKNTKLKTKLVNRIVCVSYRSPSLFYLLVHSRCTEFLFALHHTQTHTTVSRTPLGEGSARRRDLYLTTQTLYKRQTSMPPVGFEPRIPASARPQTYALDRAATSTPINVMNMQSPVKTTL
jgi:hypothetical protein